MSPVYFFSIARRLYSGGTPVVEVPRRSHCRLAQHPVTVRKFWTCSKFSPCHREGLRFWQFSAVLRRSMTEPLRNHGDHGGATAVYAVQAPQWQRASGATGVLGPYCCALRDYDETFTGDANRGHFLAMLKLTAQMQHTFQHEANIRPTSLTSLVEELSESHFYGKSMHAWGQILGNHD